MKLLLFLAMFACVSACAPRPFSSSSSLASAVPEVQFVGVVRELDRGCWRDASACRVRVDDRWLTITGRDPAVPRGRIVGFGPGGLPNELLSDQNLGVSVKVFAVALSQPSFNERGELVVGAPDPKQLSLLGSDAYYIERVR
jgi:hypothetical protein